MRLPFFAAGPSLPRAAPQRAKVIFAQDQELVATGSAAIPSVIFDQAQEMIARGSSSVVLAQDQELIARGSSRGVVLAQDQELIATGSPGGNLWPNGYRYQHEIRLKAWPGAPATPVANFLLPFCEVQTYFKTVANGGEVESSSGNDIRFESASGVKLGHRLFRYNGTLGAVAAMVNLPGWGFNAAGSIYVYTGKAGAAVEQDAALARAGGWLFWTTDNLGTDFSGQGRTLTPQGGPAQTTLANWLASNFDGGGDFMSQADSSWLNGLAALSAVVLYQPDFPTPQGRELFNVAVGSTAELFMRSSASQSRRLITGAKFGGSLYVMESADDTMPIAIGGGTVGWTLPANPALVRDTYGRAALGELTYYVNTSFGGAASTNINSPGGLYQTVAAANDGSRIIAVAGSSFAQLARGNGRELRPKPGQTGQLQFLAQNPVFTDVDVSSGDGQMVGYNRAAAAGHSVVTGQIEWIGFRDLWVEGFRLGEADERLSSDATTGGQFWFFGTNSTTSRTWYVKNYHKNNVIRGVLFGDSAKFVCYRNFFLCNRRIPGENWATDYHIFIDDGFIREIYIAENIIRGGANQHVSSKQEVLDTRIHGNVFDQTIENSQSGATTTGGQTIMLGQAPDGPGSDVTSDFAVVSYNIFRKSLNGHCLAISNQTRAIVEFNSYENPGGGTPAPVTFDLWDAAQGGPHTVERPLHPTEWIWRNNTILTPSKFIVVFGRTYINEGVQRTTVLIRDNIASANISSIFNPDGGTTGGLDFQADARLLVTFGPNSKVTPPGSGIEIA